MSKFVLGRKSLQNLTGVHPDLVKVVKRAIELTLVDFQVFEGLRTRDRQTKLVAAGASQTMNSRHLLGPDGFGHAVDLVPMIGFNGDGRLELRWDWPLCYKVAEAVRRAAVELNVPIRWGGVWDRQLAELVEIDIEQEVAEYVARRKAAGRRAFIDGPHFELPSSLYP